MLDKTIETHKILRADDGGAFMQRFGVFKIPLVPHDLCDIFHAQWSGDYPSIPVSSPMVWPEGFDHPLSHLPFRSSLQSSIVSLTLLYLSQAIYGESAVRVIIPRAKLLGSQSDWTGSSFRLFPLDRNAREVCAIAGTRWIDEGLEVFDFNQARVQRALTSKRARVTAVSSSLPFCYTIPMNRRDIRYDEVLADDEHIVGIRYEVSCPVVYPIFYARSDDIFGIQDKQAGYEFTTNIIADVWTL